MKRYYTDLIFMVSSGIFIFCAVMMFSKMPKHMPAPIQAPIMNAPTQAHATSHSFKSTYTNNSLSVNLNKIQLKTPNVIVVAEDGSGDVKDLRVAMDIVEEGNKVILKAGKFRLPDDLYNIPSFELEGEGEATVIEINDGLLINRSDLKISHVKIINHSSLAAIRVTSNRKLEIHDVSIMGNNTGTGISVSGGNLKMKNVKINRSHTGLDFDNPTSLDVHDVEITSSDDGVQFRSDDNFDLHQITFDQIRDYNVYFNKGFKGKLTCNDCQLTDKLTNVDERLLLGSHK